MDEGGFAPWIRMGAQPTARMDVYVPCLHEFLRERQQPPHVFQHGVEDAKLFCFVGMSGTKFSPASTFVTTGLRPHRTTTHLEYNSLSLPELSRHAEPLGAPDPEKQANEQTHYSDRAQTFHEQAYYSDLPSVWYE